MCLPTNFVPTLSKTEIKRRDQGCENSTNEELQKLALDKVALTAFKPLTWLILNNYIINLLYYHFKQPGQHSRELNPYWKDGGTGLPEEATSVQESSSKATDVGDSGLRWLRQALRRAEEQAREEDRTLEEVAAERWGVSILSYKFNVKLPY